ncbi:MAG: tetratricopeptide repeat protein [Bacteroidaceae bacterium]|nr:tetratricopeptide repeat protein [Bacteroidaceae bacterium]
MKRRLFLPAAILLLSLVVTDAAGQSRMTAKGSRLLDECRTLFVQGDYAAAGALLEEWEKEQGTVNPVRTEEIEYMHAVIMAERDLTVAMPYILSFQLKYPYSIYDNKMMALAGSSYFSVHEYDHAILCFEECDPELLEADDCQRMVRHYAISLFRSGKVDDGLLQLNILDFMLDGTPDADVDFYRAYSEYYEGRFDKADEGFRKCLGGPRNDEARLYLAEMALNGHGNIDYALQTADDLVENCDDEYVEMEAERILGEYYYKVGNYDKAVEFLTSYINSDSPSDAVYDSYLLGMSYFNTGKTDLAIEYLSPVSEGESDIAQNASLHVGLAALALGEKNMARMAFERASNLPGQPSVREQALYNYAMLVQETSYSPFAESVTSFERFLNEFPGSAYVDRVNSYLADAYLNTQNYDIALASIAKINNPGATILEAKQKLLYRKAMDLFSDGNLNDVPKLLTDVIALDRYNHKVATESFFWRGESYYRLGSQKQAETDWNRYLSLVGNGRSSYGGLANYGLGYVNYRRGDYDKAEQLFRNVIERAGNGVSKEIIADAALRAGDCMFYQRKYSDAKEYYRKALSSNRSVGDYVLYQSALVSGLQRNYVEKISDLDRLVRDYPESAYVPTALYEEGRAYQQTDKPSQAIQLFRRIVTNYSSSDLARKASAEIALIYYQQDNYDEAISAYKDVIAKYPGSDEARTAMSDLRSIYVEKGDINSYLEYASQIQGAVPIAVSERDSLTYAAAESMFGRGEKSQSLALFSQYLSQFPNGAYAADAWFYQGEIYQVLREYGRSVESYLRAADFSNSRYTEEALDRAAHIDWTNGEWTRAMNTYIRLYEKTASADRQLKCLYGIVSSAGRSDNMSTVLKYADKALQTKLNPEQKTEVSYWKAKASLSENRPEAKELLSELSKDTRSQYGAEASYLLSQYLYDKGDRNAAQENIMSFIQEGTPHMYWIARSFILLSDIYKAQGKDLEARQYLISLKSNYTESDDIADMIKERLGE